MKIYYVNNTKQPNGDNEVHEEDCSFLKIAVNTTRLGLFSNCKPAVEAAKYYHKQVNGCKFCSPACHTQ